MILIKQLNVRVRADLKEALLLLSITKNITVTVLMEEAIEYIIKKYSKSKGD